MTPDPASWRARRLFTLVVLLFGLVFGLIASAQAMLRAPIFGWTLSWADVILQNLVPWMLLAALAPAVLAFTERFRLDRPPRWNAALAHVAGAVLFTLVHQAGAWYGIWLYEDQAAFGRVYRKLLILNFAADVVAYCAMVAGIHAWMYYREFRARELAASQMQAGLTQARLEALRAQLNPHFLFNTLHAISVLAMKGEQQSVVRMLAQLSDLLRLSLDGQMPQEVPLAAELDFVDRYLDLQRIRFSDRLTIDLRLDPDTLDAAVPSLLLQPLVENAVVHGVAPQRGPGQVMVRSRRDGDALCLEVGDSGPGFPEHEPVREGVGLGNTRARLEQLYGARQSLRCTRGATGGARVTIRLPFRQIGASASAGAGASAATAGTIAGSIARAGGGA